MRSKTMEVDITSLRKFSYTIDPTIDVEKFIILNYSSKNIHKLISKIYNYILNIKYATEGVNYPSVSLNTFYNVKSLNSNIIRFLSYIRILYLRVTGPYIDNVKTLSIQDNGVNITATIEAYYQDEVSTWY